ncbi:MAG TPA: hypothetical protein VFW94_06325 [Candidatus Acidoferrales bacterium]|nr:hypothetical protein [Candidatus Acidoferrales bacterium]
MTSRATYTTRIFSAVALLSIALSVDSFGWPVTASLSAHAHAHRSVAAAIPDADEILNKYLDATGGSEAWKKIYSRVSQGNVIIPSMNLIGTAEMFEGAPDRALVKITVSDSTFLEGFDGKIAWSSDPKQGVREQTGAQVAETRRASDFRFPLDFRKLYPRIAAPTATTLDNRSVYVIDAIPPGSEKPDRAYFDAQTGFLVRIVTQHHNDDGTVEPFEEDFSDYRAVDGVKIPFKIHQTGAQVDFTILIKSVRQNVPLDDTRFLKPVAQ